MLVDLAVQAGRKRQSSQTGFVHYAYHALDEEVHYTIPILENFLFALALFRTRTTENILEAKAILNGLLAFQVPEGENYGSFPVYIHEYPKCTDHCLGISLLPAIYRLVTEFRLVLGTELKQNLEKSADQLLRHALKVFESHEIPYHFGLKLAASLKAFGIHWHKQEIENRGQDLLNRYLEQGELASWYNPNYLAEILIAIQMIYPHMAISPWRSFWDFLGKSWHRKTCSYAGPAIKLFQHKFEPQVGLYDLFLGYFTRTFSERALVDSPSHLQAALIHPCEELLPMPQLPFQWEVNNQSTLWRVFHDEKRFYSILLEGVKKNEADKGSHLFRFVWGDQHRVHTLVCQGGNVKSVFSQSQPTHLEFLFTLGDPVEFGDREKNREVLFFCDMQENAKFLVDCTGLVSEDLDSARRSQIEASVARVQQEEHHSQIGKCDNKDRFGKVAASPNLQKLIPCSLKGTTATTFGLGEELTMQMDKQNFNFKWTLEKGEGQFMGHIMPGNRPSQLAIKGNQRFQAYDWQVFLRTLRRTSECNLRLTLGVISEE